MLLPWCDIMESQGNTLGSLLSASFNERRERGKGDEKENETPEVTVTPRAELALASLLTFSLPYANKKRSLQLLCIS